MKKILVIAAMMAMFVACQNVEEKAKDYQKAIIEAVEAEDYVKAAELEKEFEEWGMGLSEEDQVKAAEAAATVLKDHLM